MTQHLHAEFVEGCYRCDLSRDEAERAALMPVVRIVIETQDAGGDAIEAVAWLAEWAQRVADEAPFSVEHIHVEAPMHAVVVDV